MNKKPQTPLKKFQDRAKTLLKDVKEALEALILVPTPAPIVIKPGRLR